MSNSVYPINPAFKPALTGIIAAAGEKYLLNQQDMTRSMYFAIAVAGGTYMGSMVGSYLPVLVPTVGFIDGKTLEVRLAEVGSGAAAAYFLNTQILKNDYQYSQMTTKLAIIAGSDFIAEYLVDYFEGIPPSFFS
jgi:hypothetical protein